MRGDCFRYLAEEAQNKKGPLPDLQVSHANPNIYFDAQHFQHQISLFSLYKLSLLNDLCMLHVKRNAC